MEKSQTAKFLSWNLSRVTEIFCRPKIKQDSLNTKMASSRSGQHRNEFIALMAAYLLALTTLSTPLSCLLLGLLWLVTGKAQWGLGLYKDQKSHFCRVTIDELYFCHTFCEFFYLKQNLKKTHSFAPSFNLRRTNLRPAKRPSI